MVRALQDGEGGLGAEDVLIGVMRAGHVTRTGLGPVSEGNAHEVMPAISR